jgi:hypothetical protein
VSHFDFKRVGHWVVWCTAAKKWADVVDGKCEACHEDISDRIKKEAA